MKKTGKLRIIFPFVNRKRAVAAAFCVAILSGCTTAQKTADAADEGSPPQTGTAADAKGVLAKGGTTASSRYVDPMISANRGQAQVGNQVPQTAQPGAPEATTGQASPSIAGLANQPTGVRAGSFSIFSSPTAPAPAPEQMPGGATTSAPQATGPVPALGRVNAASTSVFSSQRPPATCGTDAAGVPLSC